MRNSILRELFACEKPVGAIRHLIATTFLCSIAVSGQAAQWCGGTVKGAYVHRLGYLYVKPSFHPDWLMICDINSEWKGVSATTCKSWQSLVMTLQLSEKPMTMWYDGDTACNALPIYESAPSPGYVMMNP